MENQIKVDDKDRRILDLLKENSKFSTSKISRKLNLPITTVFHRMKKLEKFGVIKRYTVDVDEGKLGKPISAWILITVDRTAIEGVGKDQETIAKDILRFDEVKEVYSITGTTDLIVKVISKDIKELNLFLIKKLRKTEGIEKTQTSIVLNAFHK